MNFLFDIGNVIVKFDFISALKSLTPKTEDSSKRNLRIEKVLECKDEFEAGRLTAEEYFPWAMGALGFTGDQQHFMEVWNNIFTANSPMWECIEKLNQAGHKLYLFSNIQSSHKDFLLKNFPIFKMFKGGIFSYQTGHIKPESSIYEIAIVEYRLTPEKTIYIDDLRANIEAGKKAGFICHQYDVDKHDEFLNWLDSYI